MDWVLQQGAEALCLQEIKARPDQIADADHEKFFQYDACWNPATRPGYSGVVTFSRKEPMEIGQGMGIERFDLEGRVVWAHYADFWLYNVYFPNGQRDHGRLSFKLEFYAHLLAICDAMHASGEKLIITGDFNTAHREIDLRNPKQNETTSGFLPEERAWIDRYLEHGFVDAYRALYPDRIQYTWWTYRLNARARNIGWRLDYFLVSEALMNRVKDVVIYEEVAGSDHCPVMLVLD